MFNFWGFLPLTAPPEIVRAPKTIWHIYSIWAISIPPYDICTVSLLRYRAHKFAVTHTHTHTHARPQLGLHRFPDAVSIGTKKVILV